MDKKKDDILTKTFRERLNDYKLPVSDDVWKMIEQDLPPIQKTNKHSLWVRTGLAIAAAIAILLGFNWYLFYLQINIEREMLSSVIEVQQIQKIPIVEKQKESLPFEKIKKLAIVHPEIKTTDNILQNEPVQTIKKQVEETTNDVSEKQQETTEKIIASSPDLHKPDLWINPKKQKANGNLSFALAYAGQTTTLSNGNLNPLQRYSKTFPRVMNVNTESLDNPLISNIQYKIPVTVGLSIRKHFTSNWSLESGLTYTYLESTETLTHINGEFSTKNIQLNYIGIPLNVVYSFYTNNRFSLYASTGGRVEKNISGKEKISTNRSTTQLKVPELQWSLSGNVGLSYKLTDHFNLFAEPGFGYYFDDKSEIKTIRKDQPWNLNIQVGVRLDLK